MTAPAFAQDAFTLKIREPSKTADRHGDVPRGAVIRTDERYNDPNGLFPYAGCGFDDACNYNP
jgi:hypothetical protein